MTAYQQGREDFTRYMIRYSPDRARAILDEYEQIIDRYKRHGVTIIDPAWEAEYIRGGRDATSPTHTNCIPKEA